MIKEIATALGIAVCVLTARGQGVWDVHSHNVPESFIESLGRHNALLEEGFPIPAWNMADHLKMMGPIGQIAG